MWPADTTLSPICPNRPSPREAEAAQIVTLVWLRRHSGPWCFLKPRRSYVPYDPFWMWECSDCANAQLGISQSVINVSPFHPLCSREMTSHIDRKSWHVLPRVSSIHNFLFKFANQRIYLLFMYAWTWESDDFFLFVQPSVSSLVLWTHWFDYLSIK